MTSEAYVEQRARREVQDSPGRRLTPHQVVVLRLLSFGRSYKEVAAWLNVSPDTVKSHVRALYRRLGVHTGAHAVRVGMERGLLRPFDTEPRPGSVTLRRGPVSVDAYRALLADLDGDDP